VVAVSLGLLVSGSESESEEHHFRPLGAAVGRGKLSLYGAQ
jgi:hypothetical protein